MFNKVIVLIGAIGILACLSVILFLIMSAL